MAKLVGMNRKRAGYALAAVKEFINQTQADNLPTAIGDLIGDLLHFCDQEGLDFERLLRKGRGYHAKETASRCKKCKRIYDGDDLDCTDDLCVECEAKRLAQKRITKGIEL